MEYERDELYFYGGYGNKLICKMPNVDLANAFDNLNKKIVGTRGLRRFAGLIEDNMEDYGN